MRFNNCLVNENCLLLSEQKFKLISFEKTIIEHQGSKERGVRMPRNRL